MSATIDELTGVLERERHLLEYLLFKLIAARHLLTAGETRFLGWSSEEVERAAGRLRQAEAVRARAATRLAGELALGPVPPTTLRQLAGSSPEPYRTILDDHRLAMYELMGEIEVVLAENRDLAVDGMRLVADVVSLLESSMGGDEHE
jgi:hypothetical protein